MRYSIQAAFGRYLFGPLGHKRHGIGSHFASYLHHLGGRGHFKVEVCFHNRAQCSDIFILYVPPVAAQVNGDAACSREVRERGGCDEARLKRPARLPNRSYVIYVDVESDSSTHCPAIALHLVSPALRMDCCPF
jgi:hypothetical protein